MLRLSILKEKNEKIPDEIREAAKALLTIKKVQSDKLKSPK